jgi:hypothetical protein
MNHRKPAPDTFHIPCRQCGSSLHRSASGLLCIECSSKIIPTSNLSDYYEAYSDKHVDRLPENTCNDALEIAVIISRIHKLESGKLSDKQRTRLRHQLDKAFHRMTLDRLKIENENLRQRRILFEGYEAEDIQIQRTLF